MFDKDAKDLCVTLSEMERQALIKANFSKSEAREKMVEWMKNDRRLDSFDKAALARRVQECKSCGAHLDLDDPVLKGQPPRPLDRRYG